MKDDEWDGGEVVEQGWEREGKRLSWNVDSCRDQRLLVGVVQGRVGASRMSLLSKGLCDPLHRPCTHLAIGSSDIDNLHLLRRFLPARGLFLKELFELLRGDATQRMLLALSWLGIRFGPVGCLDRMLCRACRCGSSRGGRRCCCWFHRAMRRNSSRSRNGLARRGRVFVVEREDRFETLSSGMHGIVPNCSSALKEKNNEHWDVAVMTALRTFCCSNSSYHFGASSIETVFSTKDSKLVICVMRDAQV